MLHYLCNTIQWHRRSIVNSIDCFTVIIHYLIQYICVNTYVYSSVQYITSGDEDKKKINSYHLFTKDNRDKYKVGSYIPYAEYIYSELQKYRPLLRQFQIKDKQYNQSR